VLVALGRLQLGDLHGLRLAHRVAQQGHELRHLWVVEQPAVLDDREGHVEPARHVVGRDQVDARLLALGHARRATKELARLQGSG